MLVEEEFCFRPMELGNNFIDTYTHSSFSLLFNCIKQREEFHITFRLCKFVCDFQYLVCSIHKGKMPLIQGISI